MGAKFKSKTHLLNIFFDFGAVFCAFGFKVWKKYYSNMTYKKVRKKSRKVSKNAEFHADFKSVEKIFNTKCTKKKL